MLPPSLNKLVQELNKLPGIGPKSAERLAFYLLRCEEDKARSLGEAILSLKKGLCVCHLCQNISSRTPCAICSNSQRDSGIVCVVEEPLDVLVIEKTQEYNGLYHILHGALSPLENIGPDSLKIKELLGRIEEAPPREIVLATNPNTNGEATALYLLRLLQKFKNIKTTHLAYGLSLGGELGYTDQVTLGRAFRGRTEYH
ncbi:MAG TPA: recombination protein RecR [Candidatus Peregrinibacteria bacterium]|nr:recombination protein RecR [Candidatus Peregrinibacteria bacterium]